MFASQASNVAIKRGKQLWTTIPFYMLLVTFAFIVGTRYMVGMDYEQYMSIVEKGDSHYYYEKLEFLNRYLIDVVNGLNLKFYWWFIFMAFVQILFIAIAVKNNFRKVFPWIILSFFMLYISFYMNGVRQGAALSCFICATTFIKERKLYHYLVLIFIGTLFHRSIIIWTPVYWIVNKELFQNIKIQYLLLGVSIVVFPIVFDVIVQKLLPFMSVIGYGNLTSSLKTALEDIAIGSGLGVAFRYLRWIVIIAYYNKLKAFIGKEVFIPLYNLFFIGILLDAATMQIIVLNRMLMYGAILEIFILGSLFHYMTKTKNKLDRITIFTILILQTILTLVLPSIIGSFKWHTIWDAPYRIF
ncbi:MAG: EpsG family protein [Bacteroidaceae bacterium]|nr:EpsG family protein [Bacteroidaceae bacterium]